MRRRSFTRDDSGAALVLVLIVIIGKVPQLAFVAPTSWLSHGSTPFAALAAI